MGRVCSFATAFLLFLCSAAIDGADSGVTPLLEALKRVGPEGRGNGAAAGAWRQLVRSEASVLPTLLAAMDDANPLAANWIRGAVDAIAERALSRGGKLPVPALESFVADVRHHPRPRRLAFDWLTRVDPGAADRLIPKMLDDPGVEFRRDAVARLLRQAEEVAKIGKKPAAVDLYRKALAAGRDLDQVQLATKRLRAFGEEVDLPRHFGFIMNWKLLGPFDNTGTRGFDTAYEPERVIDLHGECKGKDGPVRWKDHRTADPYGAVDLNKAVGRQKGVLCYALHDFTSEEPRKVEFRLGTVNAWKVWLNGELLFTRNEYHHGTRIDHYRVEARLGRGKNRILLKVCQNEQTQDYADKWSFQFRVCDATGTAILSTTRPESDKGNASKEEGK